MYLCVDYQYIVSLLNLNPDVYKKVVFTLSRREREGGGGETVVEVRR